MRALVTGATGFVGTRLVERLLADGVQVVVAGRRRPAMGHPGCVAEFLNFDLSRVTELHPSALTGVDCIYHLAARVHVMRPGAVDEQQFNELNVRATQRLAATAVQAGVRRFVYLSSIKVNGERTANRPFTALDEPAPEDAYGRSKLAAEQALKVLAKQAGLQVIIVRPPLVYGPGVGANFLRLISLVNAGWPLPFGAVANRRSLVSVWNLVDLLCHLANDGNAANGAWLVSDEDDLSTPRLIELLGGALGRANTRLLPVPVPILRAMAAVAGQRAQIARLVDSLQVDISATCRELGWRPSLSVVEGIERTVTWFKGTRRAA